MVLESHGGQRERDVGIERTDGGTLGRGTLRCGAYGRGFLPPRAHEVGAEPALGLVLIVCVALVSGPFDRALAAERDRREVIELEEAGLRAPHARRTDKRALLVVTRMHFALHLIRGVSRVRAIWARLGGARARGRAELLLLQVGQERVEGAVEHDR